MKKLIILPIIGLMLAVNGFTQKFFVNQGDVNLIKNTKTFNVEFNFDSIKIGELANETEYINQKIKEHNAEVAGKGEQWCIEWKDNKKTRFIPAFLENFDFAAKKAGISLALNDKNQAYTMLVKTTFIEIGFTGYSFAKSPAKINLEFIFYKSNDRQHPLTTIAVNEVKGTVGEWGYTSGLRIASGYAEAGTELAKFLVKAIYK